MTPCERFASFEPGWLQRVFSRNRRQSPETAKKWILTLSEIDPSVDPIGYSEVLSGLVQWARTGELPEVQGDG